MDYIKGVTFAPFAKKGTFLKKETKDSLIEMKERTGANFIILVPNGLQETPQSETISYVNEANVTDDELKEMILFAQDLGVRVALKPTVNCKNGTWRAYINFFDEDVPCEPKWCNWFKSYTDFQLHYAKIAELTGCEMFIAGCEMVMSEHREAEWRTLIKEIQSIFNGLVSYNTDKYQEQNVSWWDCVDVISSSGYYPIDDWDRQLERIESVVKKYNKPFFFAEIGCMSTKGSSFVPNNWELQGEIDLQEQKNWYETMVSKTKNKAWIQGYALWSWDAKLYSQSAASSHRFYEIYRKPAEEIIRNFYKDK